MLRNEINYHNSDDDHHHHEEGENQDQDKEWDLDEIVRIVDEILENDDKDKDGYINWSEFMMGQQNRNSVWCSHLKWSLHLHVYLLSISLDFSGSFGDENVSSKCGNILAKEHFPFNAIDVVKITDNKH